MFYISKATDYVVPKGLCTLLFPVRISSLNPLKMSVKSPRTLIRFEVEMTNATAGNGLGTDADGCRKKCQHDFLPPAGNDDCRGGESYERG